MGTSAARYAIGVLVLTLLAGIAFTAALDQSLKRQLAAVRVDSAHHASEIARAKVETVTVKLAAAKTALDRALPTVRVDTLMLAPVTHTDTVTAVGQLGALSQKHSELQAKCSAFEITCDEFRLAAQHRDSSQQHEIAVLRDDAKRAQPGRLRRTWESVDQWVYLAGGICIGAALSGHRCLP